MKAPHWLWITDPWDTLDQPNDTTLRLMTEALKLGIPQSLAPVTQIQTPQITAAAGNTLTQSCLHARPLLEKTTTGEFRFGAARPCPLTDFSQIHYRPDPPVDLHYLQPLLLLATGSKKPLPLINPLAVLTGRLEKTEAFYFPTLLPPSLAAMHWPSLLQFGQTHQTTVLKPLHEAQSKGVERLEWRTPQQIQAAKKAIARLSQNFQTPVLLQKFLPGIKDGETRLWFAGGKFLAACKKLPLENDFRVNLDQGSLLEKHTLSLTEKKRIIPSLERHLQRHGISLAAVDLIEEKITDFNFTSPGLIPQMEALLAENLAKIIVKRLLKKKAV